MQVVEEADSHDTADALVELAPGEASVDAAAEAAVDAAELVVDQLSMMLEHAGSVTHSSARRSSLGTEPPASASAPVAVHEAVSAAAVLPVAVSAAAAVLA